MSVSFFVSLPNATRPLGSLGPLDEMDDMYAFGSERRLDPTPEQERAAGWIYGPNLSNSNAAMILRSLGYEGDETRLDADDLHGRCLLALAVPPVDDSGIADSRHGNIIDCGVRPGYFADVHHQLATLAEVAKFHGVHVSAC